MNALSSHTGTLARVHCGILLLLAPVGIGCQSARFVTKTTNHGVVAIPADSNTWPFFHRDRADALMNEHFPEGYIVELEQEQVVGTTTDVQHPLRNARVDVGDVTLDLGGLTTATSRNETEWQIHYRRR